jgi:hypothetical protein
MAAKEVDERMAAAVAAAGAAAGRVWDFMDRREGELAKYATESRPSKQ